MLEQELLVEVDERPAPEHDDERRRYYRITPFGEAVARAEARRLERARAARARQRLRAAEGVMRLYRVLLHCYPRRSAPNTAPSSVRRLRATLREARVIRARVALRLARAVGDVARATPRALARRPACARTCATRCASLARARGFTLTAILVSALGIGATTAAFSIADHVLLRPLPFPRSDRLVQLWQDQSFRGYPRIELSPSNYRDWKRLATSFEGMAAYTSHSANLVGQGEPERLEGTMITPERLRSCACRPRSAAR